MKEFVVYVTGIHIRDLDGFARTLTKLYGTVNEIVSYCNPVTGKQRGLVKIEFAFQSSKQNFINSQRFTIATMQEAAARGCKD